MDARTGKPALKSRASTWLKGAIFFVAGALLAWQVLALGVADTTDQSDPQTALAWRGAQAAALARVAEEQFESAKSPSEFASAESLAIRSLSHGPLEVSAVRVLGVSETLKGRADYAANLLSIAQRLSLRDRPTQLWLLDRSLKLADYSGAVSHADALLRTSDDSPSMVTALIQIASDPRAVAPLVAHLSAQPDWRRRFLPRLGAEATGPDTPFLIFRGLLAGPAPATADETEPYFDRLVAAGLYQPAYIRWQVLFAPEDTWSAGPPYDGAFTGRPGPPPFNWRLSGQQGVTAEFASRGGSADGRGLHVAYDTASSQEFARQLILLPAGEYVLSGRVSFDNQPESGQLGWTLKCADGGQVLLQARDGGPTGQWLRFAHPFAVPASNCEAQWLIADGRVGSVIGDLSAWYSNLRISSAPSQPDLPNPVVPK